MSLRQRIVLTLVGITVLLTVPTAVSLWSLEQVHQTVHLLQNRDVQATDAYGDLRNAIETGSDAQTRFVALQGLRDVTLGDPEDAERASVRVDSAAREVDRAFARLAERGYGAAAAPARRQWDTVQALVAREHAAVVAGRADEAEALREEVTAAFQRLDAAVPAIGRTIGARTAGAVRDAETVALSAVTTTLIALAVALAATLVIGALMTRTLLRPIGELRRGMATVAEGDFDPEVHIPTERTDELGDLARSFGTMTEQLRELDRLKAEFVSVASHEIKTPLSVIRGYVTLLADGIYGEVNEQQHKTLEAVSAQTDRLSRLVHRLLDVSRFEAGGARLELRDIDLRAFFEELTADFRVLAGQNQIDFPVRLADDLPPTIVGDEDRLSEVLGNLLSNAFKFTSAGGTIRMDAARQDGGIQVEVEDTGVGIPPEKLPRIFEKFYQVESDGQPRASGSGLGLAIAREIVEAHGGTIGAESQVGKGTRVRVFLPERPPAPGAS